MMELKKYMYKIISNHKNIRKYWNNWIYTIVVSMIQHDIIEIQLCIIDTLVGEICLFTILIELIYRKIVFFT